MAKPTERLNKAQLLARIAELETELGLAQTSVAELSRQVDAHMVNERPSRRYVDQNPFADTVAIERKPGARITARREVPSHFAAARELAMRTGRAIKVVVSA